MDIFTTTLGSIGVFVTLYFEVFLLISLFEKKNDNHESIQEHTPAVTVIVPCFNEEKTVKKTIESLLSLDYPTDKLHIMIVDDGSTDNTAKAIEEFKDHPQIIVHHKPNGGKYTALNYGIEKSNTDFVGCLDADSFVEKSALKNIMRRFSSPKVMAVTPSMIITEPDNLLRKMQKAEYSYGNFMRKAFSKISAIHITPGPFSFFRKEVFEKIGYYKHAHNTEDMEMAMRMQKNRMIIRNAPDAIVHTTGPGTVKKLYKQRVRWVSGFLGNLIDYRHMMFSKEFGDLGLIVLPFSFFGVFLTLAFIFITVYKNIIELFNTIVKWQTVGWQAPHFTFDLFFLNTSIVSILSTFLLVVIFALIIYGERETSGKWTISLGTFYFIFIYSFIAPFWLLKSIYNNILSKEASWR